MKPLGYFIGSAPNRYLEMLRETEEANLSFFASRPVLLMDSEFTLRRLPESRFISGARHYVLADVPIAQIAGIFLSSALSRQELPFVEGVSFRQVLFAHLHGASLNEMSLPYLVGPQVKHPDYDHYAEFPQTDEYKGTSGQARGGISLTKRGAWYFADQGQQRVIMAMFAIAHAMGPSGALRNVRVQQPEA